MHITRQGTGSGRRKKAIIVKGPKGAEPGRVARAVSMDWKGWRLGVVTEEQSEMRTFIQWLYAACPVCFKERARRAQARVLWMGAYKNM